MHAAPVNAAYDHSKVLVFGLPAEQLGNDLLRTLLSFGFAALPMCDSVGFVEALDATPGEGSAFNHFAGHEALVPQVLARLYLELFAPLLANASHNTPPVL